VECVSGISHVTPKWNVSSGMCQKIYQLYLILNNSQKNCNVIKCNHYKVEHAFLMGFLGKFH